MTQIPESEKGDPFSQKLTKIPIWVIFICFGIVLAIWFMYKRAILSGIETTIVYAILGIILYLRYRMLNLETLSEFFSPEEQQENALRYCKYQQQNGWSVIPEGFIQILGHYWNRMRQDFVPYADNLIMRITKPEGGVEEYTMRLDPRRFGVGVLKVTPHFRDYPEGNSDIIMFIPPEEKLKREWQRPGFFTDFLKDKKTGERTSLGGSL